MIEEYLDSIRRLTIEVGTIIDDAPMAASAAALNVMLQRGEATDAALKENIQQMNKPMVLKVLNALEGTNGDVKTESVSKLLFRDAVARMKSKDSQMTALRSAMSTCTRLLLVKGYGADDGAIAWGSFKQDLREIISALDKAEGAATALAAAAAMAVEP
jgi:hypothetical protein